MWDANLVWGSDLSITATGDVMLVAASDLTQQRVLRRLITNSNDYIWHPEYGAGLASFVGQTNSANSVAGVVYQQIFLEAAVARQPVPVVSATSSNYGSLAVSIQYADAVSGSPDLLSFSMSI